MTEKNFVSSWMWCRNVDDDRVYRRQDLDVRISYWVLRQVDGTWKWFRMVGLDAPDHIHAGFRSFEEAAIDCEKTEKY